ncbi:MAG: LPS-assembly protein LptD, partial [Gammaproteobacteria bacterium]
MLYKRSIQLIVFCMMLMPTYNGYSEVKTNSLAERLGWITNPASRNLCGGYYIEPKLNAFNLPKQDIKKSKTSITFDNATYHEKGTITLSGHVVVIQSGRRLEAERAIIHRDPIAGKPTSIDLYGNIKVMEPGKLFTGQRAHLKLNEKAGNIQGVYYRIVLPSDKELVTLAQPVGNNQIKYTEITAWGRAKEVIQSGPGKLEFTSATYTTCPPNRNQWRLNAAEIKLDKTKGWGSARNVTLTVKNIPVVYFPHLTFPINKKRKTGFLFPTFGYSNVSGFQISTPFYINLAPNYDLTLTPKLYSDRGILLKENFRYMTRYSYGFINATYMPSDRKYEEFKSTASASYPNQFGLSDLLSSSNNRSLITVQDHSEYNQHWSSDVDFTHVSDDYYFQDFGTIPAEISANQLLRQGTIKYESEHWTMLGLLQSYDTLHPVNRQPLNNIYSRLPEFDLNGTYPNAFAGLDYSFQNQMVYFFRAFGPGDTATPPRALRFNVAPSVSLPYYATSGYFIPSLQLQATQYSLQQQPIMSPNSIGRVLPLFNIDSGLYFDRDFHAGGRAYQQTLEPRLFYLYVPYHNQNNIPIFDSAVIPFTYYQLFQTNRFSGDDRIGDANQLSIGITSRIIDEETGLERLHAGIGQIYYFKNRVVTICNTPGCTDLYTGLGAAPYTSTSSPIVANLGYNIGSYWSVNADTAWDTNQRSFTTTNVYVQYKPRLNTVLNLGYNFVSNGDIIAGLPAGSSQNNFNQTTVSYAVPLTEKLSSMGLWTYDISQRNTLS